MPAVFQCGVLGPLEVLDIQGRVITPSGALQRRLLARLLLERGRTVSTDALVEALWGDALPADPRAAIQTHVSRLRQSLPGIALDQIGPGYLLHDEHVRIDAAELEAAVAEATAVRSHDPEQALDLLGAALARWRGEPYADLAELDEALLEARRLEEIKLRATEERLALLLACGDVDSVIAEVSPLTAREPLRDRPRELMMRALAAAGRIPDALRAFDEHRRRLSEELGIEPSSTLLALHESLLRGDGDGPAPAPARGGDAITWEVPHAGPALVGRDADLLHITDALDHARVVTLVGPGGVGKTSLAVHAAHRSTDDFPDGVCLVELAGTTPRSVDSDVLAALGVEPRAPHSAARRLADLVGDRRVLVVLDNCEHVLDEVATLVEELTARTTSLRVLATSRERLTVGGERLVPVSPLPWAANDDGLAPAVELFVAKARALVPGYDVNTSDVDVVTDICRQVDGLPLAIELAATRLLGLTAEQIRDGLRSSHALLEGGRRAVSRHRSMSAAVSWSIELLGHDERDLLHAVAHFTSPFDTDDAAAVVDTPPHGVLAGLASLVERSLLNRHGGRYSLLEPIRQHVIGLIDEPSQNRERHARRVVEIAETLAADLRTTDVVAALDRMRAVLPDLRTAFRWAMDHGELGLATRLVISTREAALYTMIAEPLEWARELAAAASQEDHPGVLPALGAAALGAWKAGELDLTDELLDRADAEALRLGLDRHYLTLDMGGTRAVARGRLGEAADSYAAAVRLAELAGDELWASESRAMLVAARSYAHDPTAAEHAEQLVTTHLPRGCPAGEAWCWYGAGEAVLSHDPALARQRLTQALELARACSIVFVEGVAGASLASIEVRHGSAADAVEMYRWLLPLLLRGGTRAPLRTALRTVVELLVRLDELEAAATLYGTVTSPASADVFGDDDERLAELRSTLGERLGDERCSALADQGRGLDDVAATNLVSAVFDRRSDNHDL